MDINDNLEDGILPENKIAECQNNTGIFFTHIFNYINLIVCSFNKALFVDSCCGEGDGSCNRLAKTKYVNMSANA